MSSHASLPPPGLATAMLHADHPDPQKNANHPIAPAIETSTTFRALPVESELVQSFLNGAKIDFQDPGIQIYSRWNQDARGRLEKVLSDLTKGEAITFGSGIAAAFACVLHYAPSVIAIRKGYHGVHQGMQVYARGRTDLKFIDLDDEYPTFDKNPPAEKNGVRRGGLLVWAESPLNPTGEVRDLEHYAQRAHEAGGYLGVDATFAPPPLTNPLDQGADIVMHSATKYMGGHSDLLAGVVVVKTKAEWESLFYDRVATGGVLGNLESYLLLRSLRTFTMRVERQSQTAHQLATWLESLTKDAEQPSAAKEDAELVSGKAVEWVWHGSLQPRTRKDPQGRLVESPGFDPRKQMSGGFAPCFSFRMATFAGACALPQRTHYFTPATSLGGVESLLEQRVMSDPQEDKCLIRLSIGIEDFVDLQADLRQALLAAMQARVPA